MFKEVIMKQKSSLSKTLLCLWGIVLFLSACSDTSSSDLKENKMKEDQYEKLAEEKNAELELTPVELTTYAEEIGVTLKEPVHKEFAVNGEVVVEGEIEKYAQLKSDFAWIKVYANEEGPAGNQHEYYTPIEDGKFKQAIHFF